MEAARRAFCQAQENAERRHREPFIYYALPKEYERLKQLGADMTNIRVIEPLRTTE